MCENTILLNTNLVLNNSSDQRTSVDKTRLFNHKAFHNISGLDLELPSYLQEQQYDELN